MIDITCKIHCDRHQMNQDVSWTNIGTKRGRKNDEKTVKDLERQNDFTVCVSVPNIEKTAPMNF